jgi:predicted dehydrogenase
MAEAHVSALVQAGYAPTRILVVGRERERVEALAARQGVEAAWGGVAALDRSAPVAIVAVTESALAPTASALVERGARRLLVEKPGALDPGDLEHLAERAQSVGAAVYVAYNRRFYRSVACARALIEEDGGPLAVAFEFSEVERLVLDDAERRGLQADVLSRWGLANSLHVIDLAFFLAGEPDRLSTERVGSLPWHPAGAVYAGSGATERGALFAYHAVWSGAGRWGVELTTKARKLVLRPLETLQQQLRGSFALEDVDVPAEPSGSKPGLHDQLAAFLSADDAPAEPLCTLEIAAARLVLAQKILGYR